LLGELERDRHRNFAEFALPRLLDVDRYFDSVTDEDVCTESFRDFLFNGMEHGKL